MITYVVQAIGQESQTVFGVMSNLEQARLLALALIDEFHKLFERSSLGSCCYEYLQVEQWRGPLMFKQELRWELVDNRQTFEERWVDALTPEKLGWKECEADDSWDDEDDEVLKVYLAYTRDMLVPRGTESC